MTLDRVKALAEAAGLSWRGAFHPGAEDLPGAAVAGTIILLGFVGGENWAAFSSSPEYDDGEPHALDRWSHRVISALAMDIGATPYFPFTGPPFAPFMQWAAKAEPVRQSAIGMMIHPDFGTWHAWRGALLFEEKFKLPSKDERPNPCDACREKPCLSACPVNAFADGAYDVSACDSHLREEEGADCTARGCRARRACPVGARYRYGAEQAAFHMRAFIGRAR